MRESIGWTCISVFSFVNIYLHLSLHEHLYTFTIYGQASPCYPLRAHVLNTCHNGQNMAYTGQLVVK